MTADKLIVILGLVAAIGRAYGNGLMYNRTYHLRGNNFTDIAPKIDAVNAAIELVAEP